MNKEIMKQMGFKKEVNLVNNFICPFCGEKVDIFGGFKDKLSRKEFDISGLCQKCQDETFG